MQQAGAALRCGEHGGFSCGAQAVGARPSVVVAHGLSICYTGSVFVTWAQLLHGMWDLPRPGMEPVSPALTGGFSTTEPPEKFLGDIYTNM